MTRPASEVSTPAIHAEHPLSQPSLSSPMERVFFQLHSRLCHWTWRYTSARGRRVVERTVLLMSILGFGALILLHQCCVYRGTANCATTCLEPWRHHGADVYHVVVLPNATLSSLYLQRPKLTHALPNSCESNATIMDQTSIHESPPPEWVTHHVLYSYSTTKAYLLLPKDHAFRQQLTIQYFVISPDDAKCFGEPFLQTLLHSMVGHDTVAFNWLLSLHAKESKLAYVQHARTTRIQELPPTTGSMLPHPPSTTPLYVWSSLTSWWNTIDHTNLPTWDLQGYLTALPTRVGSKLAVLVQTSFLFFFCTTLVSFTLRETQERMVEFTQELTRRVGSQLPRMDLVMTHLVHNLVFVPIMVGMMFFLIEFYAGDKFLAFLVLSIVWFVEVFSVICHQGMAFFPRIFFLLFCLFHIYYFATPYGFSYTALAVVGCFMGHSMFFFWHRYELPAVALGWVTVDRPRMHTAMTATMPPTTPDSTLSALAPPTANPTETLAQPLQPPTHDEPAHTHLAARPAVLSFHDNEYLPGNHNTPELSPVRQPPSNTTQLPHPMNARTNPQGSFSSTTSSRMTSGLFRDDDDESYSYFMGGEVVLHRTEMPRSESFNANSRQELGLDMSERNMSEEDLPVVHPPRTASSSALYPDESSGLQAILEVRLAPRPRTTEDRRSSSALPPTLPSLPP